MSSMQKKYKKHKHKKSYKKKPAEPEPDTSNEQIDVMESFVIEESDHPEVSIEDNGIDLDDLLNTQSNILQIKVKSADNLSDDDSKLSQKCKLDKTKLQSTVKKSSKKKDGSHKGEDDTDSEEERWLVAIESGRLEEVDDELKRMKNPRLMTARQRALMEKRSDAVDEGFPNIPAEPLLALPSGFKEKVETEEMLAKKAIKSKRRREQAMEKREEDKKKTVDRLLKKQDSKISKLSRTKNAKKDTPLLSYIDNKDGIFLSSPLGIPFPLEPQIQRDPPKPIKCGVGNCLSLKKYSCSKTGVPLCSLECYKINLASQNTSLVR